MPTWPESRRGICLLIRHWRPGRTAWRRRCSPTRVSGSRRSGDPRGAGREPLRSGHLSSEIHHRDRSAPLSPWPRRSLNRLLHNTLGAPCAPWLTNAGACRTLVTLRTSFTKKRRSLNSRARWRCTLAAGANCVLGSPTLAFPRTHSTRRAGMKYHALFRWTFAIAGALALWVANAAPATAQQRGTIRGMVREASSQRPVAGVEIFVPGTQMRTTTDAQGRFELTGVPAGGAQVRVRAPGYSSALATTMVGAGQAVVVDFALNASVVALDEVVVTGTGATVERKQLGNTIATVKAEVIDAAPVRNFSEAIAAREAGVSILPSSGSAGEGARIRIRGNASLSQNNEPVVYVDGVRGG